MLKNIDAAVNLRGMARAKARTYTTRTIHPKLLDEALADGWVTLPLHGVQRP